MVFWKLHRVWWMSLRGSLVWSFISHILPCLLKSCLAQSSSLIFETMHPAAFQYSSSFLTSLLGHQPVSKMPRRLHNSSQQRFNPDPMSICKYLSDLTKFWTLLKRVLNPAKFKTRLSWGVFWSSLSNQIISGSTDVMVRHAWEMKSERKQRQPFHWSVNENREINAKTQKPPNI